MRPIIRKLYSKIDDKGLSFDQVLEFFDKLSPSEKKKNFPDDCLFQRDRYFAEAVLKEMLRAKLIRKEGNRYFKLIKSSDKKKETKN